MYIFNKSIFFVFKIRKLPSKNYWALYIMYRHLRCYWYFYFPNPLSSHSFKSFLVIVILVLQLFSESNFFAISVAPIASRHQPKLFVLHFMYSVKNLIRISCLSPYLISCFSLSSVWTYATISMSGSIFDTART